MNIWLLYAAQSGKDRTAMSVTLEEARILAARHNVPASRVFDTAQALRQHGKPGVLFPVHLPVPLVLPALILLRVWLL